MNNSESPSILRQFYNPIKRRKVNKHISVVLIKNESCEEFLFGQFDQTHPIKEWRGRVNFIGGSQSYEDISPIGILERELKEEFDVPSNACNRCGQAKDNSEEYAPKADIVHIRNEVLNSIRPHGDFIVSIPPVLEERDDLLSERSGMTTIYSFFKADISDKAFEIAKYNLSRGKKIRQEGDTVILDIASLSGNKFVGSVDKILEPYLVEIGYNVSLHKNPETYAEAIGKQRNYLEQYSLEFDYLNPVRICTG